GAARTRTHYEPRAAVTLPHDDLNTLHRRRAVRVQQLGTVPDDAAVFLVRAGKEAGNVGERDERNVERIACAHEPTGLLGRIDVEASREHLRLVPYDPDHVATDTRVPAHDVHRPQREHLEEVGIVDDLGDDLLHVVRAVRRI